MPPHDETVVGPAPADPDDDLFDESWQAPKRTNRLTAVLVVALLVVGGFVGGVLAQKHHDSGIVAATAGVRRAGAGLTGARGGAAGPGEAGDAGTEAPVVTGTVRTVDTDAIEVTDSTGAIVRVFVPKTATVTTPGLGGLAFGNPVSVTGTKAVDGSVTATSVTARRTSG
jgi:hypothetical protein